LQTLALSYLADRGGAPQQDLDDVLCIDARNVVVLLPEFNRSSQRGVVGELFSAVLELCEEAGLVEVGVTAIDGTKICANASRGANRTYEKPVADILKEAEETDRWEDGLFGPDRAPRSRPRSRRSLPPTALWNCRTRPTEPSRPGTSRP